MGKIILTCGKICSGKSYYSKQLKEELNAETMEIMNSCLNKVNECLTNDWAIVEDMAQEMLKKEELTFKEVEDIFQRHGKGKKSDIKEEMKDDKVSETEDVKTEKNKQEETKPEN